VKRNVNLKGKTIDKMMHPPLLPLQQPQTHPNNTGQQNLTSIDELSSTFYAEFRNVYRIFLSGRFSKIQRN